MGCPAFLFLILSQKKSLRHRKKISLNNFEWEKFYDYIRPVRIYKVQIQEQKILVQRGYVDTVRKNIKIRKYINNQLEENWTSAQIRLICLWVKNKKTAKVGS